MGKSSATFGQLVDPACKIRHLQIPLLITSIGCTSARMPTLTLRTLFSKITYRLGEELVEIEHKTLFSRNRVSIPLDSFQFRSQISSVSSKTLFWVTVVFVALTIAMIGDRLFGSNAEPGAAFVYGGLAVVFGVFYLASRKSFEVFPGYQNNLYFAYSAKSSRDIQSFMEEVSRSKLATIKKRAFLSIDTSDRADALNYLKGRRNDAIISDEDFAKLKSEIDAYSDTSRSIGFTQTS